MQLIARKHYIQIILTVRLILYKIILKKCVKTFIFNQIKSIKSNSIRVIQ